MTTGVLVLLAILVVMVIILSIVVAVVAVGNAKLWIKILAIEASTHTITHIDPLKQTFQAPPSEKEAGEMTKRGDEAYGSEDEE